jgi:hypothetical protein
MKGGARVKALGLSIILFWVAMMGWLVKRSYFPQRPVFEPAVRTGVRTGDTILIY